MRLLALLASLSLWAGSNEPGPPGRIFFLNLRGARLVSANPDGSDAKVVAGERACFVTDLGGNVYSARLDGSDKKIILTGQRALTGIAYAEAPK